MYQIVTSLLPLDDTTERTALTGPATRVHHDAVASRLGVLRSLEIQPTPHTGEGSAPKTLRIGAWNLERCKYPDASVALLHEAGVDIVLVSEMDYGMARSGNINTTRYVAQRFGAGYAFAVEFVELGLGNDQEMALFKGQTNSHGYHGNAIISKVEFRNPDVIAIGDPGSWFCHDWHHRRLGQRNCVTVTIDPQSTPVKLMSVHLENLSTPGQRRVQMQRILETLDPAEPVIIAGDMNTSALPDMASEPDWFSRAPLYEPLFELMATSGFDWQEANSTDQTRRIINDGRPLPLPRRIDWFFVRGIRASNAITWPAVTRDGLVLSDHELITIDVELG
jgi:endonuclease/exonuclease/phosphatase family metal-dependent hydrolase